MVSRSMALAARVGLVGLACTAHALLVPCTSSAQDSVDIPSQAAVIKQVDRFGEGNVEASRAVRALSNVPASRLPEVLTAMNGASPLSANWFRAAVEAIADRDPQAVPVPELLGFLRDRSNGPYARGLAFDLVVDREPDSREALIETFLDDPCLELRYMAIEQGMNRVRELASNEENEAATAGYTALLEAARNPDQITSIAAELEKLGSPVDLTEHFGFVTAWHLIGPFDNRDKIGFEAVYAPEDTIDLAGVYAGKEGELKWSQHRTEEANGVVNLNVAVGKHMGAVGYAFTTIVVPDDIVAEVRLGSPNGNQVWINGELVISNHVYHAGNSIDQYAGRVTLLKGENHILVKVCQNEQTDSWAQDWQFQLRLCDASGKKIEWQEK
ncbi:MAG: hypothetical protein R3B96_21475 [Pirellulaceae bacterium]